MKERVIEIIHKWYHTVFNPDDLFMGEDILEIVDQIFDELM